MKTNKRIIGQIIASAAVSTTPDEATIPDSKHNTIKQALAQLGQALAAYGPFVLGRDMTYVPAGIRVDVLNARKEQTADFSQTEFEAFLQRAHDVCAGALDQQGETSERLTAEAEEFAVAEGRDVDAVRSLFTSMATHGRTSLISTEGELIDIGIAAPAKDERDPALEIEVARIKQIARIKTTEGQFDTPLECAQLLKVGDHIRAQGVQPLTGAACIRADSIDAETDPTGELFGDSAHAEAQGHPDDTE